MGKAINGEGRQKNPGQMHLAAFSDFPPDRKNERRYRTGFLLNPWNVHMAVVHLGACRLRNCSIPIPPSHMTDSSLPSDSNEPSTSTSPVVSESIPSDSAGNSTPPSGLAQEKSGGPINLEQIRKMRESQQARLEQDKNRQRREKQSKVKTPQKDKKHVMPAIGSKPGSARTASGAPGATGAIDTDHSAGTESVAEVIPDTYVPEKIDAEAEMPRYRSNRDSASGVAPKVPVPNVRSLSTDDELAALEDAIAGTDLDGLMIGDKSLRVGRSLEDGSRHQGKVIKVHNANVFISLGGPDEGVVPLLQFTNPPEAGQVVDCLIRSFNREEGLYELSIPGEAITVNDWDDLNEGAVVEAKVESSNTGGVECKVGNVRGFIPISQLSEFRIESSADYIGQTLLCVITEANPRRGNLVLSHRAVLERDKEAKRKERMEKLEVGQACEGTVRKVTDFGAFVDIGGLDGLIHISQLSWEKIKHPSEVVKEGDKIQVRIEKFDPETGKIALSYRSLQDNPWSDVDARFPVGTTVRGTVSRLANFGAFVKLGTGVEGLIHISELAHKRVANVANILQEGQDVEVKILTVDRDSQRIGLSLRATQAKPETAKSAAKPEPEDEPKREPAVRKFQGALKGGTGSGSGGDLFGLRF